MFIVGMGDPVLMAAPIGGQIRAICAILNARGPLHYRQVTDQMTGVECTNVHKCLQRAARLGIVTRHDKVYGLTLNWQDILKAPRPQKPPKIIINSVWSLAHV